MRLLLSEWVLQLSSSRFPWGTLSVNWLGSFLAGAALAWFESRGDSSSSVLRLFVMVGVLGGLTTWSALALDVLLLSREQALGGALVYVVASLLSGLILVFLGWWCGLMWRT